MAISSDEIRRMSVAERLALIEALWDSIADEQEAVPVNEAQRRELDRRLEAYARGETRLSSWEEVRARLQGQE
jgi:putative addiction module component (TIGR02574 family)